MFRYKECSCYLAQAGWEKYIDKACWRLLNKRSPLMLRTVCKKKRYGIVRNQSSALQKGAARCLGSESDDKCLQDELSDD